MSAGWSGIPTSSTRRCCTAATSILYEGKPVGTPDAGAFWRVIAEHRRGRPVHRADRLPRHQEGRSEGQLDRQIRPVEIPHAVPRRRARRSADTSQWAERHAEGAGHRPLVADRDRLVHRRQSGRPRRCCRSSTARPTVPMPGYDVQVVDEGCNDVPADTIGSIVVKLPLPPACFPTLWQQDERFKESYLAEFPGYYKTADAGYHRRRRLCLRHGPHRRHHQCRGPSPLDRRHGGGAGGAIPTSPNAR